MSTDAALIQAWYARCTAARADELAGPMGFTRLVAVATNRARPTPILTKRWRLKAGVPVSESYDRGYLFKHHALVWPDSTDEIAAVLRHLAADRHGALMNGALTPEAVAAGPEKPMRCLLAPRTDAPATIRDAARCWHFNDWDDVESPPGLCWHADPVGTIRAALKPVLPQAIFDADMIVAWSGSQGFKDKLRFKTLHRTTLPLDYAKLKVLYADAVGADSAAWRARQLIYIAAPVLRDGIADPVAERTFVVRGEREVAPITEADLDPARIVRATRSTRATQRGGGAAVARIDGRFPHHDHEVEDLFAAIGAAGLGRHELIVKAAVALIRRNVGQQNAVEIIADLAHRHFAADRDWHAETASAVAWAVERTGADAAKVQRSPSAAGPPPPVLRDVRRALGISFLDRS